MTLIEFSEIIAIGATKYETKDYAAFELLEMRIEAYPIY